MLQPRRIGLYAQILSKPHGLSWPVVALLTAVPPVFWAVSLLLALVHPALFHALAREDGPIEGAQAVVLLGCALLSARIAFALYRTNNPAWGLLYSGLTIGFVWIAGEEISWGQRIFGFNTPGQLENNKQGEANLHNLPNVTYTLHSMVEYVLYLLIALSLLISYRAPSKMVRWRTWLWMPPPILIPAWLCFLSYRWVWALDVWWYQLNKPHVMVLRLQESAELILYGGVLIFLAMASARARPGASPRHTPEWSGASGGREAIDAGRR